MNDWKTADNLVHKPWIPFCATNFIDKIIKPEFEIFEWGSGGSTLYWSERCKKVTSIEYNFEWYNEMKLKLIDKSNVNLIHIPPEHIGPSAKTNPALDEPWFFDINAYCSRSTEYTEHRWHNYCSIIDNYEPFNLILIDGNSRPSCIKHAYNKIKLGGWVVVDNMDRNYYHQACNELFGKWKRYDFYGNGPYFESDIKWKTTIWNRSI